MQVCYCLLAGLLLFLTLVLMTESRVCIKHAPFTELYVPSGPG